MVQEGAACGVGDGRAAIGEDVRSRTRDNRALSMFIN